MTSAISAACNLTSLPHSYVPRAVVLTEKTNHIDGSVALPHATFLPNRRTDFKGLT
jgi:hypothetical protein